VWLWHGSRWGDEAILWGSSILCARSPPRDHSPKGPKVDTLQPSVVARNHCTYVCSLFRLLPSSGKSIQSRDLWMDQVQAVENLSNPSRMGISRWYRQQHVSRCLNCRLQQPSQSSQQEEQEFEPSITLETLKRRVAAKDLFASRRRRGSSRDDQAAYGDGYYNGLAPGQFKWFRHSPWGGV